MDSIDNADPNVWKKWLASLSANPEILTTDMSLIGIHKIVETVSKRKVIGCRDALYDLLGGQFTIMKTKEDAEEKRLKEAAEEASKSSAITRLEIERVNRPQVDSSRPCFPLTGIVHTKDNSIKTLADLRVGDEVLASDRHHGQPVWSKVYMFAHKGGLETSVDFVTLRCSGDKMITLSPRHLIFVGNMDKAIFARDVVVGDVLLDHQGSPCEVIQVGRKVLNGFCAPITTAGTIVVDGILASCYAEVATLTAPIVGCISGHDVAHFGMAPVRAMDRWKLVDFSAEKEMDGMPTVMQWAQKYALPCVSP